MSDLEALRQQAESLKDNIKQKRKECLYTTMQQVKHNRYHNDDVISDPEALFLIHIFRGGVKLEKKCDLGRIEKEREREGEREYRWELGGGRPERSLSCRALPRLPSRDYPFIDR